MGVFTRFKDIISSNINSMLDKAEDPEKMIKLMIREMEETLVELKAACAGHMADRKKVTRELDEVDDRVETWEKRARMAVEKGREDLAREALMEKRRWRERADALEHEQARFDALIDQSQEDIAALEEKLNAAREKERLLVQRHIRADTKRRAQRDIRRAASGDSVRRFEEFEQRIERMEAEADLVNMARSPDLEEEFTVLESDEDIERELAELKGEPAAEQAAQAEAEPKAGAKK
jgi:phage shock protein A